MHKSASDKDIRAAYKRLSKKWHPDKNKSPEAEGKFVEIARGAWRHTRKGNKCTDKQCSIRSALGCDSEIDSRSKPSMVAYCAFRNAKSTIGMARKGSRLMKAVSSPEQTHSTCSQTSLVVVRNLASLK